MFPHPVPQFTRQPIQMQAPSPQTIWDTHALASKHPRSTHSSQKPWALVMLLIKGSWLKTPYDLSYRARWIPTNQQQAPSLRKQLSVVQCSSTFPCNEKYPSTRQLAQKNKGLSLRHWASQVGSLTGHLSSFLTKLLKFWKQKQFALCSTPFLSRVLLENKASLACTQSGTTSTSLPGHPILCIHSHWDIHSVTGYTEVRTLSSGLVVAWISCPTTQQNKHWNCSCDTSGERWE